jgi:hypothetical protein
MEAGQIDRTQLTPQYGVQLTDHAVQATSYQLKEYGASPIGAQVLRSHTAGDQTIHLGDLAPVSQASLWSRVFNIRVLIKETRFARA